MRSYLSVLVVLHLTLPSLAWSEEVRIQKTKEQLKEALAISSDFKMYAEKVKTEKYKFAKGLYEYGVKIRETKSGKELKTLEWDKDWGNPSDGSFSPDGKMLSIMCGGQDRERAAKVFDISSGEMKFNVRHSQLKFVVFTPDSTKLASAGGPGASDSKSTLWIWDLETRKKNVIRAPSTPTSLAFSPDGKFVVTGHGKYVRDRKAALSLCDTSSGKLIARWEADDTDVSTVAFSPDGKAIASGGKDGTVRVWSAATHKEIASFDDNQEEVFSLAFYPKGNLLASTGKDKTIRCWDLGKKKLVSTTKMGKLDYFLMLMFSADGKQLATYASRDNTLNLWSVELIK